MKRISGILIILIILILLILPGCSNMKNIREDSTIFYVGRSDSWLATYSITKVKSIYYNSLSIQYLFDDNNDYKKAGPIEYKLIGNSMITRSSSPQELQGDAYFHTGNRVNSDAFKVTFDRKIKLIIGWQNKSETFELIKQN